MIYHLAQNQEWEKAKHSGKYWPAFSDSCGFIHFSFERQLNKTANTFFKGRKDLILIAVEESLLGEDLKFELVQNDHDSFPHLYRPLNTIEVIKTLSVIPDLNGNFDFTVLISNP